MKTTQTRKNFWIPFSWKKNYYEGNIRSDPGKPHHSWQEPIVISPRSWPYLAWPGKMLPIKRTGTTSHKLY